MGRLRDLLHVASPSTCNMQQNILDEKRLCNLHQEEELQRLIRLISDYHNFSQEDYEEALEVALSDPVEALTCFTSLARSAKLL